jgi:alginate O-acetyltransferase complex protein AlgI
MLFNSLEYAILLGTVFFVYWILAQHKALRLLLLLAASYLFYAWWSAYYLILVLFSSTVDFVVGQRLHASPTAAGRKRWLLVSLIINLTLLGTFKYFNFFVGSLEEALTHLGLPATHFQLNVVVPVGISFYTFESLSYIIDIYRRRIEPVVNPLEFFVFIAFFPHLVAGPIMRAADFLPQLHPAPSLTSEAGSRGFFLIAVGLAKKAIIADVLAVNLVDRIFETPARYTSAEILAGVYGYALQIYCDFSAYSDIAMGSALLFGLTLTQNFNVPYRAASLQDFWRRWHMTLSTWLRDYLYIPLGGSRGSTGLTYRNLLLTMLLGGLWHGAAWTFVVWGALHGAGLALDRAYHEWRGERAASRLWRVLMVFCTFHYVCLGWIFFRASSFSNAWEVLSGLGQLTPGTANVSPVLWLTLLAGFGTHFIPGRLVQQIQLLLARLPAVTQAALLTLAVLGVRWAGASAVVPFIYFQF